eukprot:gnl/TRDRNA2_/TRDRNA2_176978_c0_seq18.p1 gnl/TRDRNA2_/TRDRNA2_176978_c0~~gnl/TRDRNA2_/TRDRNA2_176978_c0_seq18.p1  ORF type:complete len:241 (+),score=39.51 gnl/TRDRNA2_/TRDRNA2_176978_c0_seq18:54-776(+)
MRCHFVPWITLLCCSWVQADNGGDDCEVARYWMSQSPPGVKAPTNARQCLLDCLQTTELLYSCEQWRATYAWVCCNNQRYAEPRGFQERVLFFNKLEASGASNGEISFYDSQCGKLLYVAPRGRSYEEFKKESKSHGWPSFRKEEVVYANVKEKGGMGELVSTCGTHLGHNLPDSKGERHCINLMCMAGTGSANQTLSVKPGEPAEGDDDSTSSATTSAVPTQLAAVSCVSLLLLALSLA